MMKMTMMLDGNSMCSSETIHVKFDTSCLVIFGNLADNFFHYDLEFYCVGSYHVDTGRGRGGPGFWLGLIPSVLTRISSK